MAFEARSLWAQSKACTFSGVQRRLSQLFGVDDLSLTYYARPCCRVPLLLRFETMAELAKRLALFQFLFLGWHTSVTRPPFIVTASVHIVTVYVPFAAQVVRLDVPGFAAMRALLGVPPVEPHLPALAYV